MSRQRKMTKRRKQRRMLLSIGAVVLVALVVVLATQDISKMWNGEEVSGSGQGTAGLSGGAGTGDGKETSEAGKDGAVSGEGSENKGNNEATGNGGATGENGTQNGGSEQGESSGDGDKNNQSEGPGTEGTVKEDPSTPSKEVELEDPEKVAQTGKGGKNAALVLAKPTAPKGSFTLQPDQKLVALTFDDGPDEKYTPAILDILKENDVKATFFLVGVQVRKYPSMVKRIVDEGHEVGNHSYNHSDLAKLDAAGVKKQIKWTDDLFQQAVGFVPHLVRAPYGSTSSTVKSVLKQGERELIGWTVDTRDWGGESVAKMLVNINKNTKPGGVILMHSFGGKNIKNTVELVPKAIEDLKKQGYTFVTIDELHDAQQQEKAVAKQ